ncbi:hypothetical protein GCM10023339_76640 [Alloalcanivorax gelatiniphagus]
MLVVTESPPPAGSSDEANRMLNERRTWVRSGTELFADAIERLNDADLAAPSLLPGWTRAHVLAHVASNARALTNLVRWAATGIPTPMYSSLEQRQLEIESGAQLARDELVLRALSDAANLESAMDDLDATQWRREVITVQGRTVEASEIPWLRAREVCVHAVDLDVGSTFGDLPSPFVAALTAEVAAKRDLSELPAGDAAEVAAWLTGRPHALTGATALGPWL